MQFKKICSLFLVIAMILSTCTFTTFAAGEQALEVTFEDGAGEAISEVNVGDIFYATFTLKGFETIAGVQFGLNYDESVVQIVADDGSAPTSYSNATKNRIYTQLTYNEDGDRVFSSQAGIQSYTGGLFSFNISSDLPGTNGAAYAPYTLEGDSLTLIKVRFKAVAAGNPGFSYDAKLGKLQPTFDPLEIAPSNDDIATLTVGGGSAPVQTGEKLEVTYENAEGVAISEVDVDDIFYAVFTLKGFETIAGVQFGLNYDESVVKIVAADGSAPTSYSNATTNRIYAQLTYNEDGDRVFSSQAGIQSYSNGLFSFNISSDLPGTNGVAYAPYTIEGDSLTLIKVRFKAVAAGNPGFSYDAKLGKLQPTFDPLEIAPSNDDIATLTIGGSGEQPSAKDVAVAAAIAAIDALPEADALTLDDKADVEAARAKVDAAKALGAADADITNLDVLVAAEAKIAELEAEADAEALKAQAIADAIAAIDALPAADALTLDNKAAVEAARAKVDAAKALGAADADITNLDTLVAAEAKIVELEHAAAVDPTTPGAVVVKQGDKTNGGALTVNAFDATAGAIEISMNDNLALSDTAKVMYFIKNITTGSWTQSVKKAASEATYAWTPSENGIFRIVAMVSDPATGEMAKQHVAYVKISGVVEDVPTPTPSGQILEVTYENADGATISDVNVGDTFYAVFTLKGFETIAGVQFGLNYDESVVQIVAEDGSAPTSYSNATTNRIYTQLTYNDDGDRVFSSQAGIQSYSNGLFSFNISSDLPGTNGVAYAPYTLEGDSLTLIKVRFKAVAAGDPGFSYDAKLGKLQPTFDPLEIAPSNDNIAALTIGGGSTPTPSGQVLEVTYENADGTAISDVNVGDTFYAVFTLKGFETIAGVQFGLNYDESVVQIVAADGSAPTSYSNATTNRIYTQLTYNEDGDRVFSSQAGIQSYTGGLFSFNISSDLPGTNGAAYAPYTLESDSLTLIKVRFKAVAAGNPGFSYDAKLGKLQPTFDPLEIATSNDNIANLTIN